VTRETKRPLQDRAAVVTGPARGIGRAIAHRLAGNGAQVALVDHDAATLTAVATALGAEGLSVIALSADIASLTCVTALATSLRERFGSLHILVNNAAILDMTAIDALTLERFEAVLRVNLTGAVLCTMQLLPLMNPGWGRIVNVGSITGLRGQPGSIPYATVKGGLTNFTRSLATDLGPRSITVNAPVPGFIDTRMAQLPKGSGQEHSTDSFRRIYIKEGCILLRRPGTPENVASWGRFWPSMGT
jgi:NAD(P)-dependent dehydrogenase (short-subunit alcohol dehydrogenase family)